MKKKSVLTEYSDTRRVICLDCNVTNLHAEPEMDIDVFVSAGNRTFECSDTTVKCERRIRTEFQVRKIRFGGYRLHKI